MSDKPNDKPVSMDQPAVKQHKKMAAGVKISGQSNNKKADKTKKTSK
jgi:hypothetical protein